MYTLHFICAFLLTLLLSIASLAASLTMIFSTEELTDMGVRLDPSTAFGEESLA
jgi:hypothetical protein